MKKPQATVLTATLREAFAKGWQSCRVIYFGAPCGMGKTATAQALLAEHTVFSLSAMEPGFWPGSVPAGCDAVLIDDFQYLRLSADQAAICACINKNPALHFVFLGRGPLPGWLMPYQFTGLLTSIGPRTLLLDQSAVRSLLADSDVVLGENELSDLLEDTEGYPLFVAAIARQLAGGAPYTRQLVEEARHELFHYVEEAVYHRFAPPMRRLLVSLAPFAEFDAELARLVSGDNRVNDLLGQILHETTMLETGTTDHYRFWSIFQRFLRWELKQEYTPAEQNDIYRRAGLYYELHDDYAHAMDCYIKSGDHAKMSDLLIKNAGLHPGLAHYYEMERYYNALPRADILRSPVLMTGMSMLCALCLDFDASESWYGELKAYAAALSKTDANRSIAQSQLLYLDIALPQRGIRGMTDLLTTAFRLMTTRNFTMPELSVTSTLPSIMNGGKDFCEWSKKDDLLYHTMRLPLETVLGRDGVGLADCAICESKFEKGEDVSSRVLSLMGRMGEIQRSGTPDIYFAVMGLLARVQVIQGKSRSALDVLEGVRRSFTEAGQARFLPNLDAMRCRIWLRSGETEKAFRWLREDAPSIVPRFRAMWRYQYLTKAMVLLAADAPEDVLLLLAPMPPYCAHCGRTMDGLYTILLAAICHYRQKNECWQAELADALHTAAEYGFITPVAQFGAAILPLLNACTPACDPAFFEAVRTAAREQAVFYPDFLRPAAALNAPLTPAEKQVLKLLCYNRSNREIAEVLGVKVPTVKSQVTSILQKLGVKRRAEAKETAETMHLV